MLQIGGLAPPTRPRGGPEGGRDNLENFIKTTNILKFFHGCEVPKFKRNNFSWYRIMTISILRTQNGRRHIFFLPWKKGVSRFPQAAHVKFQIYLTPEIPPWDHGTWSRHEVVAQNIKLTTCRRRTKLKVMSHIRVSLCLTVAAWSC